MYRKVTIALVIIVLAAAGGYGYLRWRNSHSTPIPSQNHNEGFDKSQYSLTDPTSPWVIVNKQRLLPATYAPADLVDINVPKRGDKSREELQLRAEAGQHLAELVTVAKAEGLNLMLGSAFRSYQLQKTYYDNYVRQSGRAEAERFSAEPGKSEHQTGWAADLAPTSGKCYLELCFAEEPEGKWLAANAYKFGFIISYQKGKEAITGYEYEPWHLRYVGVELSTELHNHGNPTLEEFFAVQ